ncbi:uncharacterized protein Tco025E_07304 [Trypanosoma conorhini]|uniref:Uncharacterized protein n=1 Tax=Trypanosoma conorhini TaxID=83891 RepID=A0A3R7KQQ1_9TRYP|nr:uncharacterized protein Tco025E_07304 [Trypanosoma conorhini]RNF07853.1 hypothetical protein Tco025E_07304 [Trypanosoma conorhini]
MAGSEDVCSFIIEALQRLVQPLVFVRSEYAVAAVPCGELGTRVGENEETHATTPGSADAAASLLPAATSEEEAAVRAMARRLFDHALRRWAVDTEEAMLNGLGSQRRRTQAARFLITSTASMGSTVPLVTAVVYSFLRHHRHLKHSAESITGYLQDALELLLLWSHPAMGVAVSASVVGPQPEVTTDVQYGSPLLPRPWTKNEVLLAVACAPEWSLRELCGSRRLASWIHRYITSTKLVPAVVATRLARWSWLERRLRRLMTPADVAVLARTLCALLLALELELVAGTSSRGPLPRDVERDSEGLTLLLGILNERGAATTRSGTRGKEKKEHCTSSCEGRLHGFDERLSTVAAETSMEAFLSEQPTCVDFVAATDAAFRGGARGPAVAVRRLCGVADELYRFLSEWMRLTVNARLDALTAQLPRIGGGGAPQPLPRLTIVVGHVQEAQDDASHALPLSMVPVHLFGDLVLDAQLRGVRCRDGGDAACGVGPLNCEAAKSLRGAHVNGGSHVHEGARALARIPLWLGADDAQDDVVGDGGRAGAQMSSWLAGLVVAGAVRCFDASPAHWQRRALAWMRDVVAATNVRQRQWNPFLRLRLGGVRETPLLLLRHAFSEVRYALAPWTMFPSLPGDVGAGRAVRGRLPREFLDPGLQPQKGLMHGHAHWTVPELDYIEELRQGYQRVFARASVALAAGAEDISLGLHVVPAPLHLQQRLTAEGRARIAGAVTASLAARLLPRPSQEEQPRAALFSPDCSARYCAFPPDSAAHRRLAARGGLPDAASVKGSLCAAAELPPASFRLRESETELTAGGAEYLARLSLSPPPQPSPAGSGEGRGTVQDEAPVGPRGATAGGGGCACCDAAPLALEEWNRMIEDMLLPTAAAGS